MNIKFTLVPKKVHSVLPEIKQIRETAGSPGTKEVKTLDELLYGKEKTLDDILTD